MTEVSLIVSILSKPMPPLRPHTWIFGPKEEPLGVVFNTWPMSVDHLVCRDGDGQLVKPARFRAMSYFGKRHPIRALQVSHRKYFYALLKEFKGLSAGDL